MTREYTLYFAWVPPGTPWDLSLARFDENIFDFELEHDEGQIPTVSIEIKNPHIGFISPSRLYWCWISFSYDACEPQPLFFGRLVGIPEEIEENTVRMKFIARDTDYIKQKQRVAESLKIAPNYDEIFFDVMKRDDPDAILEGWSVLYHVDRVDGKVSASDILVGEDGTVHFADQDVFYDSVKCRILQSPLKAVNVKMEVHWAQQTSGNIVVGQWAWPTIGQEPFIGDWPKSGTSLGGGWHVGVAWAGTRDPAADPAAPFNQETALINTKPTQISTTYNWVNTAKKHTTGDTMSVAINYTQPFGKTIVLKNVNIVGIINPYAVDFEGDPDPVNIPAYAMTDWFCYRTLALRFDQMQALAVLDVCYQMDRKRSELLEMTVQSDVQPVLIDPLVTEDTEEIILRSGDLSSPLIEMLNWDSVGGGKFVNLGQFIFPDNPVVAGQTSTQICVQEGNTGAEEPIFSNIPGKTTLDGTVLWASFGSTPPTDSAQDWQPGANVGIGTLIVPRPVSGVPDMESLLAPGKLQYPPVGIPVAMYSIYSNGYDGPGAFLSQCAKSGLVGGAGNNEEPASFTGFVNPTGQFMYMAMNSGVSGMFHPSFGGSDVGDGGVHWKNIGAVNLPIGGWPSNTPASVYFPTDRGKQSMQHGICRARAKLRKRSRAVEISFDTPFEVAAQLSCRMNGVVSDIRIPGGKAFGKVTSYKLLANGDDGTFIGNVTLGCAIGNAAVIPEISARNAPTQQIVTDTGIPSYVGVAGTVNGYVKPGYQKYYSSNTLLTPGDPNYAPPGTLPIEVPPVQAPPTPPNWPVVPPTLPPVTCPPLASVWRMDHLNTLDDIGFTPPAGDVGGFDWFGNGLLLSSEWHGTAIHITQENINIYNMQLEQIIHDAVAQANIPKQVNFPSVGGVGTGTISTGQTPFYDIQMNVAIQLAQKMPQGQTLWYELSLAPVTNGPFNNAYSVDTTHLIIPMGIDLSAPSTGV